LYRIKKLSVARVVVEQVICRYGVPIAILTDRGKEVDGQLMNEVCRLLDIDKQRTTAYKASTNAAVERFHRTLNSMMGAWLTSISVTGMLRYGCFS